MGFASYDDLISELTAGKRYLLEWTKTSPGSAGVAGRWYSTWTWVGSSYATSYFANASLTSVQNWATTTGALPVGNNVSPDTKHLLLASAMTNAATGVPGMAILVDRLLHYPGVVATTAATQSMSQTVALPRYTDGAGVVAWLEVSGALGNAGAAGLGGFTMSYTNQAGIATRSISTFSSIYSGSQLTSIANTSTLTAAANPFLPYFATDSGIRTVDAVRFSGGTLTAGHVNVVLGKVLASVPIPAVNVLSERDLVFQVANLERVYDGACLCWLIYEPGALAANTPYVGEISVGWG